MTPVYLLPEADIIGIRLHFLSNFARERTGFRIRIVTLCNLPHRVKQSATIRASREITRTSNAGATTLIMLGRDPVGAKSARAPSGLLIT
jgi:hypothetical protein